jgi:hypothetical protein
MAAIDPMHAVLQAWANLIVEFPDILRTKRSYIVGFTQAEREHLSVLVRARLEEQGNQIGAENIPEQIRGMTQGGRKSRRKSRRSKRSKSKRR